MSKVVIIGNNGGGQLLTDGGSIKIRLYRDCLIKLGIDVNLVDLYGWKKHPLKLFSSIKKTMVTADSVLIMGGPKGARLLIPLVNWFNKKLHKRVVYCPLGIGTLERVVSDLNDDETISFLEGKDYYGIADEKMGKELRKLDLIIPQNEFLSNAYRKFYNLNNVETLNNFRDVPLVNRDFIKHNPFKIIYISRIAKNKGIFLLLEAVSLIDDVSLDIYGDNQLIGEDQFLFDEYLKNTRISYKGKVSPENSIEILRDYDLFVLPTMYKGEGTSGAFIESLIAGTPTLLSSYALVPYLIKDGKNGYIFKMGDINDLIKNINIIKETLNLKSVSEEGQILSKQYLFKYNEKAFLECILGKK